MTGPPDRAALGTLLRHVLELLDGDVAAVYADLHLPDYRPRFSPLLRALVADGPLPIRDLAARVGVTHSAASQSVAQMHRAGLVRLTPGRDARQRVVTLTDRAYALLPVIEAEWAATTTAMRQLDTELPAPLADELYAVLAALRRRPLRARITDTGLAPHPTATDRPHRDHDTAGPHTDPPPDR